MGKPKVLLKSKKLKFLDSPLKCPRTSKTLNDESLRKKRKLIILDETGSELLNPCRPAWTLSLNPELKLFDKRRSLKVISTILRSNLDMLIDKPLMLVRTSKYFRVS